ncbi:hypothetical protein BFR04_06665 [Gaetbulibacter sp. 4G1]|nr:hypothetical protein BFR04_06665 [Gaetbulibacter sp. 4G1]
MALRSYDLKKANNAIDNIENPQIKLLFSNQVKYYKKGELDFLRLDTILNRDISKKSLATLNILEADYYYLKKEIIKNKYIFKKYFSALEIANELKDTLLITEVLRKLNSHLLYRSRDTLSTKAFLKEYKKFSKVSETDSYWYNYISIGYMYMLTENNFNSEDKTQIKKLFNNIYANSIIKEQPLLLAKLHQIYGIYLSHWLKDYEKANKFNMKAYGVYKRSPIWFAQKGLKGLEYNTNINYYKNKEYRKAIPFFIKDLNRDKEPILLMYTNEWLFKCYEGLKQYDSAHYYFKKMVEVKEQMKQTENAINIRKFSDKYNFEKKEQELAQLGKENSSLEKKIFTILPILGIISLILIFIFYLYKRYKKKSNILEEEQSETLQKLDELKSIVIKNHIVLKDKTKVYISDLMYVKSDDHYLEVVTQNDKKHTVRGKLSQIKEELPPNFIQCHRSYIVNSNFIKQVNATSLVLINKEQIPLSRSYKNKF